MTPEQEIKNNLEELKKYFKISSIIEKTNTKYMLHLTQADNINLYIVAMDEKDIYYKISIYGEHNSLIAESKHFSTFSIKNVEAAIIEKAEKLSTYKSHAYDFKAVFGTIKKLGVKKWMKLNSLKQKLK